MWTPRRTVLTILLVGIIVRVGIWLAFLGQPDTFVRPDSNAYLELARELVEDRTFSSHLRTPAYPLFLGLASLVVTTAPEVLALVQIALSVATMALVHRETRLHFGDGAAWLSALFVAVDVNSAILSNQLLSETLFTFLLWIAVTGTLRIARAERPGVFAVAGVGLAFSVLTLTRPIALYLPVLVAVYVLVVRRRRLAAPLRHVAILLVTAMLLPGLWIMRNYVDTGEVFVSTSPGVTTYAYRAAWNEARLTGRSFDVVRAEFNDRAEEVARTEGLNAGELAAWKTAEGMTMLRSEPLMTLRQAGYGFLALYGGISGASIDRIATSADDGEQPSALPVADRLSRLWSGSSLVSAIKAYSGLWLLVVYSGVVVSLVVWFRRGLTESQRHVAVLFLLVVAYFTLLSVGAQANARFRIPITPFLTTLAAAGWSAVLARHRERNRSAEGSTDR